MAKHLETVPGALPTEFYSDWDGSKEKLIINRTQDVEPILKENRRKRNEFNGRYGDLAHIAEIPFVVIEKLDKDGLWQSFLDGDEKVIDRWLKDPDNRAFLTAHQGF